MARGIPNYISDSPYYRSSVGRAAYSLSWSAHRMREHVDFDSYKSELVSNLAHAWKMAQEHVKQAQRHQKTAYDRSAKPPSFRVGDRVFLYMPAAKSNKAYKFTKPFQGPYLAIQ